ncbi:hypothetical protein Tco_0311231, partial [Tanacetum coccineum]
MVPSFDNAVLFRCLRSGSLMFNAFFFEISMKCLVQEFRASVSTDSNNLSLKIALNHVLPIFKPGVTLPCSCNNLAKSQLEGYLKENTKVISDLKVKEDKDIDKMIEMELKTEMHEDFEYVKSLEKEIDKLESEKADFSNMYDLLLEDCVSKDVICSYLHSLSELNAHSELQCMYLHK